MKMDLEITTAEVTLPQSWENGGLSELLEELEEATGEYHYRTLEDLLVVLLQDYLQRNRKGF